MHDHLKADTLLGIPDQGKWRFPLWQFAPDGPNGVIGGLAQVLLALQMSNLAKARWLQRPHPVRALNSGALASAQWPSRCTVTIGKATDVNCIGG